MNEQSGIHRVAVVGLGTTGRDDADVRALAGLEVACFDESATARDSLIERVRLNLAAFVEAGLVESRDVEPIVARLLTAETEAEAVSDAQFVTEAIPEDLAAKQALLVGLERMTAPETILASNSSSFPISQSGSLLEHPERALVTHWFIRPIWTGRRGGPQSAYRYDGLPNGRCGCSGPSASCRSTCGASYPAFS